jgi:hypothetical protein
VRRRFALAALAALIASSSGAQEDERLRISRVATVHLDDVNPLADGSGVELYLRALTKGRASVTELEPRDFLVREDERRIDTADLSVETLEQAQRGVACVLVLDTSPTMQEALPAMKDAALAFIERVGSYDRVAVVSFAGNVEETAAFTDSQADVRRAVDALESAVDLAPTRVYDGLYRAIEMIRREKDLPRRTIAIVFSDGSDGGSSHSLEEVVELAAGGAGETQVLVYSLGYSTGFGDAGLAALRSLSEGTTADYLQVESGVPLRDFYADIWKHVMQSYVVRVATRLDGESHLVEAATGDGAASRTARYPDAGGGVPAWVLGALGVLLLAAGAGAFLWLRRPGGLEFANGPQRGDRRALRGGLNRIGQHGESEILIKHDTVSRRHAEIEIKGGKAELRDLSSTNGTFVNDVKVEGARQLAPGDRIRFADVEVIYRR